jgi:hypothetical protein
MTLKSAFLAVFAMLTLTSVAHAADLAPPGRAEAIKIERGLAKARLGKGRFIAVSYKQGEFNAVWKLKSGGLKHISDKLGGRPHASIVQAK